MCWILNLRRRRVKLMRIRSRRIIIGVSGQSFFLNEWSLMLIFFLLISVSILDVNVVESYWELFYSRVLLAWVLSNVCTLSSIKWLGRLLKIFHLSRVFSQLLSCMRQLLFNLFLKKRKASDIAPSCFYRSTNAKASTGTGGANSAVNGYMAFLHVSTKS